MAGPGAAGLRLRRIRQGRDLPARRAAPRRRGDPHRCGTAVRAGQRDRRRAGDVGAVASTARATGGPVDARLVPGRTPGGGVACLPTVPPWDRGGARDRTVPRARPTRGADPPPRRSSPAAVHRPGQPSRHRRGEPVQGAARLRGGRRRRLLRPRSVDRRRARPSWQWRPAGHVGRSERMGQVERRAGRHRRGPPQWCRSWVGAVAVSRRWSQGPTRSPSWRPPC